MTGTLQGAQELTNQGVLTLLIDTLPEAVTFAFEDVQLHVTTVLAQVASKQHAVVERHCGIDVSVHQ
jgi:hypothetical protein